MYNALAQVIGANIDDLDANLLAATQT